jgi:hypothetical protein
LTLWAGCLHFSRRKTGFSHGGNGFLAAFQTRVIVGFRYIENGFSICLQKEVAKEVVGRVYSLDMSLSNGAMIFSIVMTTAMGDGFFKHCSYPDICRLCHRNQSVWFKQDGCA